MKVGHCQALNKNPQHVNAGGFFITGTPTLLFVWDQPAIFTISASWMTSLAEPCGFMASTLPTVPVGQGNCQAFTSEPSAVFHEVFHSRVSSRASWSTSSFHSGRLNLLRSCWYLVRYIPPRMPCESTNWLCGAYLV